MDERVAKSAQFFLLDGRRKVAVADVVDATSECVDRAQRTALGWWQQSDAVVEVARLFTGDVRTRDVGRIEGRCHARPNSSGIAWRASRPMRGRGGPARTSKSAARIASTVALPPAT